MSMGGALIQDGKKFLIVGDFNIDLLEENPNITDFDDSEEEYLQLYGGIERFYVWSEVSGRLMTHQLYWHSNSVWITLSLSLS